MVHRWYRSWLSCGNVAWFILGINVGINVGISVGLSVGCCGCMRRIGCRFVDGFGVGVLVGLTVGLPVGGVNKHMVH